MLVLLACVLLAGGATTLALVSSGQGDNDAATAPPSRGDAGVEYVDEPPGDRICEALPSFDDNRLRLRRFARAVRRVTNAPRAPVTWLIDADTATDKDDLARSLGRAGFVIDTSRYDGGAYGVRATRRTSLELTALVHEKDALLRASPARSDRTVLMVAYPRTGCEDVVPNG